MSRFALIAFLATSSGFAAPPPPDFNGDGFADLPIGIPNKDVAGASNGGAVQVMYGSASGLRAAGDQLWTQDSDGVLDKAETGDRFGAALGWGDFNGDGFSDLAIGAALEDIGTIPNAGAVNVLYGSPDGLAAGENQFWHQNASGAIDKADLNDQYGWSLAGGDFDGDGFSDLAIGVLSEDVDLAPNAGAVHVLYGSPGGLRSFADELWHQNSGGIDDAAGANDAFGWSLAAGDFDGDGRDDLAIGVRNEDVQQGILGFTTNAGAVNIIYGSHSGLTSSGDQFWNQNSFGIDDVAEVEDAFGWSLAAGDFDGNGRDDLAISVPLEDIGTTTDAGAVVVLYGAATGLLSAGNQLWRQSFDGLRGDLQAGDRFGLALAAADFDHDGRFDLAIGVPAESLGIASSAGAVNVIYGSTDGLRSNGNELWHQDSTGIRNAAERADRFGEGLMTGDFDGDGHDDLAVGVPRENIGGVPNAGAVEVIYGVASGLKGAGDQFWHQDAGGIIGQARAHDFFGSFGPPSD